MTLHERLRKTTHASGAAGNDGSDPRRDGMRVPAQALQALIETEVSQHTGAERYEWTGDRMGECDGYRQRPWDTRVGTIDLRVPRMRDGSYGFVA